VRRLVLLASLSVAACGGSVEPDPPSQAASGVAPGAIGAQGPNVGALTSIVPAVAAPGPVPRPLPTDAFDLEDPDQPANGVGPGGLKPSATASGSQSPSASAKVKPKSKPTPDGTVDPGD
jgi:hypothetical protein